ncbi:MAG TPA: ATP-binding protein [Anaerolineales bacterium]|nr:ATP-binding protein [Anaerolineales bacterium]
MAKADLILLALDESPILQLMARALMAASYEIAIVHDKEGLNKALQESSPALVLVGETFATQSGLQLAEGMLDRFPTLPILLYAERDTVGLAKDALRTGLSGYLYPPLRTDDIVNAVNRSLTRARRLGDWLRREVKMTTSQLEERAKLSESERARYESIFANIQDGVIVLDSHNKVVFANHLISEIFGVNEKEIVGQPLLDCIQHPDVRALLSRATEGPLKYHEINLDNGQVLNAQYTPIPKIGSAITMQDISYLKELDRLKNDFVHTVSHDLRSPLTALLGYAELIDRIGPLNDQQREFMQRIQASVQHITTLVNDLLDLGRLEAGFDTRREMVHIESILKYTLDTYDGEARTKNITLSSTVNPDVPALRANPIRIRQLLDNLVGNAIKYTQESGNVHVDVNVQDNQIILEVKDTGPGIPQNEQNRIFEKFYRATNVPDGSQGTGLGLAIVKSIVESQHGRIWVESTLGQGSSFFVVLPVHEQIP